MRKRNSLTSELLKRDELSKLPLKYHPQMVRRTRLQSALKAQVPDGVIKLNKRLSSLENLDDGTVRLAFQNGDQTVVDLVVGGDGIRSVCPSPSCDL
jgi:salicylate hydroxylase